MTTSKQTPTPKPTVAATNSALSDAAKAAGLTDADLAAARALLGTTGTSTKTAKTPITKTTYPTIFSDTKAKSFLNQQFQKLFNRDATDAEITKWTPLLKAAQKNQAAVVGYKAAGSAATQTTQQALDEAQWFKDQALKDKALAAEYDKARLTAPELTDIQLEKRLYDEAIKKAGKDLGKIAEAKSSTAYGRRVSELEAQINAMVMDAGATNTPDDISKLAEELINKGYDTRSETGKSIIEARLKFGKNKVSTGEKTTDTYTGEALKNVETLNKVALANGLTLESVFDGPTLDEILNKVNAGEPIDTYAKIVRDAAKVVWNVSDNVAKLMDQGVSLNSIYAPYKNTYADTLELDPNSITLKDLAAMGVLGQPSKDSQAPQNIYDFTKALRKDNRWQYTQQANQEVASATQKILQDFGFMG